MLLCLMKQQADAYVAGGLSVQVAHLFRTLMLFELTKLS